jgi:hypothetical protein
MKKIAIASKKGVILKANLKACLKKLFYEYTNKK